MGNNAEIRQRMETCRIILLVLNWICAIAIVIFGFMLDIQGIGIGVIIGGVVLGIIGHFLTNVVLAIPFILLNNGDILESQTGKSGKTVGNPIKKDNNVHKEENVSNENTHESDIIDTIMDDKWICGECNTINGLYMVSCKKCGKLMKEE